METALRNEVVRQEKLEQYVAKFNTKLALRNGYLDEMIQVRNNWQPGQKMPH